MDEKKTQDILDLIAIMDESNLTALRFDDGDTKIELERAHSMLPATSMPGLAERVEALLHGKTQSHADAALPDSGNGDEVVVRSPMVGMFYVAPSPDEEPFVKIGQEVLAGQTLGIIEAMKMMNEITASASGIITEVLAANGAQVEYDQPLFAISTAQDAH